MKVSCLYWISDKVVQLRGAKLESGMIRIKKKSFQVDRSEPYFFYTGGFLRKKVIPLYILKHSSPYPLQMPLQGKLQYSSENVTNLLELKALDNILRVPTAKRGDMIMWILIGAAIGGLIAAVMFLTRIIPV